MAPPVVHSRSAAGARPLRARDGSRLPAFLFVLPLLLSVAGPARAQLVRPRAPAADAPKLLVLHYFFDDARDSAAALVVADGTRERLRVAHSDRFNTITRVDLNRVIVESGFGPDRPLELPMIGALVRHINARFVVEARVYRRGDSAFVAGRLYEAAGQAPQSANVVVGAVAARLGTGTGAELANRLMNGFRSFDNVQRCNQARERGEFDRALTEARNGLRDDSTSASAWLCIALVRQAQNAPADSITGALREAYRRDTLNTFVMRLLAQRYQAAADTNNMVDMIRRVLTIDRRDNELRISMAILLNRMGRSEDALAIIDQGLETNPASVELLRAKGVAQGALSRWAEAAQTLELAAQVDTAVVDSAFVVRITNYYKNVPDSVRLYHWTVVGTRRFPRMPAYWYDLSTLSIARGDTSQSMEAARQYLQLQPNDGRAHLLLARPYSLRGLHDSAIVHSEAAAAADSALRPYVAGFFFQAGVQALRDTNFVVAVQRLQKATDWAGDPRLRGPAAHFLSLAQIQLAAGWDREAEATRNCELVRRVLAILPDAEQNMIAGVAVDRDRANTALTQWIPGLRQRAEAFLRNFRCPAAGSGSPSPARD